MDNAIPDDVLFAAVVAFAATAAGDRGDIFEAIPVADGVFKDTAAQEYDVLFIVPVTVVNMAFPDASVIIAFAEAPVTAAEIWTVVNPVPLAAVEIANPLAAREVKPPAADTAIDADGPEYIAFEVEIAFSGVFVAVEWSVPVTDAADPIIEFVREETFFVGRMDCPLIFVVATVLIDAPAIVVTPDMILPAVECAVAAGVKVAADPLFVTFVTNVVAFGTTVDVAAPISVAFATDVILFVVAVVIADVVGGEQTI